MLSKIKHKWIVSGCGALTLAAWQLEWWGIISPSLVAILASCALLLGGYSIAANALRGVKQKQLNVDALVVIAALAALIVGAWVEAATVIFILLLGEELETVTVNKARKAITNLMQLVPEKVCVIKDGQELQLPTDQVQVDDILLIRLGERVAVDGIIVFGTSSLDQSNITGESLPADKTVGDEVYAGSLNFSGSIRVRATHVGKQSSLAKIKEMVEQARAKKAPTQRLIDRFAQWFVPCTLLVAVLVFLVTHDIIRAITVLIVACPCALVLGTPVAVIATITSAARTGLLIKGGAALENVGRLNSLVFDKTGTLTYGKPKVVEVKNFCGRNCDQEDTLSFAAIAEKLSEHPLAGAILQKAEEWELLISTPDDFVVHQGQGVKAKHEDINIILGNRRLLKENAITLTPEMETYIKNRETQGETAIIVAHHAQVCGIITLADTLRRNAFSTIHQLKALGINKTVAMYTGDNYDTAKAIARKLGIEDFLANLLPHQKVEQVQALIDKGYKVGMVGDGVNDAPALATAQVGIAMGAVGSDIAIEAADIALMTDDLSRIPQIIKLSRRTLRVIYQNLWFAILFNLGMMVLASEGSLSMIGGALLHQFSSLAVILNSMRLLYSK